ncbi:MAG TPA: cytidine deaminase [Candidatus Woesebacteria bacterium]|nr:cytidine deaminase [Candidatus Woesebacteria bacterium]
MISKEEIEKMIEVANKTEKFAYIFKSSHRFGAAVLTAKGEIFGGCNMDGVISSLGSCAEMVALHHALAHGNYDIKAVLVIDEKRYEFPCGSCLQLICQFQQSSQQKIEIISAKTNGEYLIKSLDELLPLGYYSTSFEEKLKSFKNYDD